MKTIEQIICDHTLDPKLRVKLLNMYEEKINEIEFNFSRKVEKSKGCY